MDNNLNYRLSLKDSFSKGIQGASDKVKGLDGNMNKLGNTVTRVGGAIAGFFALGKIKDFVLSIVDSLKNYESFSASLRTLMYGDALASKALEKQLVSLASRTPFSLTDVQDGTKQLLAYGFSAGKVVENMEMLGDISSAVGKPLNEIVYLYGTLRTQGRAFTKDINQFTTAGINLLPQLAKQFGVAESEVMKLVESGKVGFKDVETAFKTMTSAGGQFFNMMEVQSKTVGGQISNLGDNWEQLKVNIGKSQTGIINGTISWANEFIGQISRMISAQNQLDSSIKKSVTKSEGFGFWASSPNLRAAAGSVGLGSGMQGDEASLFDKTLSIQNEWNKKIELAQGNAVLLNKLLGESAKGITDVLSGKSDVKSYREGNLKMAVLKDAQGIIQGSLKLLSPTKSLSETAKESAKQGGSQTETKIGAATEVYGSRPQNITINLERLGDITINTENIVESAQSAKDIFSKQLLEVLNDANLIASK